MDVPIRYKKRHFKKIWHEKLEKYTVSGKSME
jgi:hypothetical protein